MTFVILDFDKNFQKYKFKISLYIFISKALWKSGKKSDNLYSDVDIAVYSVLLM